MTDSDIGLGESTIIDANAPLLFVNHDAENRKTTREAERKKKNSHVQTTVQKKKREAALNRLRFGDPRGAKPGLWCRRPEYDSSLNIYPPDVAQSDSSDKENGDYLPDNMLPCTNNDVINPIIRSQQSPISSSLSNGHYPSVRSYLDSTADQLDPFETSTIPITPVMSRTLRQYIKRIVPHYWAIPLRSESLKKPILQLILSEPHVLYAGLSIASAVKADVPRQKVKAIQAINVALQNPNEDSIVGLLYAIGHMLGVESLQAIQGSNDDVQTHIYGLLTLLNLRGGLEGLPTFVTEHILNAIYRHATIYGTVPSMPPPAPLQKELSLKTTVLLNERTSPDQQSLCTALLSPLIAEYFSPDLLNIINDLRDIIQYRENFVQSSTGLKLHEVEHISFMELRVQYSLLALPSRGPQHEIQEVCRIALLMCLNNASTDLWSPASNLFRAMISQLRNALDQTDLQSFWKPAHEALLWVLCLGAHNSEGQPERGWFINYLACGVDMEGLRTWEALRSVLLRFIFIPRIYEDSMRRIWSEVEQMDDFDMPMELSG